MAWRITLEFIGSDDCPDAHVGALAVVLSDHDADTARDALWACLAPKAAPAPMRTIVPPEARVLPQEKPQAAPQEAPMAREYSSRHWRKVLRVLPAEQTKGLTTLDAAEALGMGYSLASKVLREMYLLDEVDRRRGKEDGTSRWFWWRIKDMPQNGGMAGVTIVAGQGVTRGVC